MQPASPSLGQARVEDEAVAFLTELTRLQGEVDELSRHLERIESEMRQVLDAVACERFEEYR